jgi:hypothetical protein
MIHIPGNLTEFLYWVKERTESYWSSQASLPENYPKCDQWIRGAKWIGLKEEDIDHVERTYSISFTPEHREFLKILHTIDRKEEIEYEGPDETVKRPFFYNWLEDEAEIRRYLEWPYETIIEDVLGGNDVWLKSWGTRPSSESELKRVVSRWVREAPRLIPLTGHRFLVSDHKLKDRPVLSVWGSDIIVYGWDLRHYLLAELKEHLGLLHYEYNANHDRYYYDEAEELKKMRDVQYSNAKQKDLPYWKELIMYWSSGWSSFGLDYYKGDDSSPRPIVKAEPIENEEIKQKRFTDFGSE